MAKYTRIAHITNYHMQSTGAIVEYFVANTEHFYLCIIPSHYHNRPTIFEEYKNGKRISSEEHWYYKGTNIPIIILCSYISYLHFLWKLAIKKTIIIAYSPQFLLFHTLVHIFRDNTYILWIFDYFPESSILNFFHYALTKYYNARLQTVLYLSPFLEKTYALPPAKKHRIRKIVPFGIKKRDAMRTPVHNTIGFIGTLRGGQGLELLLQIAKNNSKILLHIVGDGPLEASLKQFVALHAMGNRVFFYDVVVGDELKTIVQNWEVGVALYKDRPKYAANYGDPGKLKMYAEYTIPIIMTNVSYMQEVITTFHAGVITPYTEQGFLAALATIQGNYASYQNGVLRMQSAYAFQKHYDTAFSFLTPTTHTAPHIAISDTSIPNENPGA